MQQTLRRLFVLGVAYTLGWLFSGLALFSVSVAVAASVALLLTFGVIPDPRLPATDTLPKREKNAVRLAVFRTAFMYGFLYFYGLALFASLSKAYFSVEPFLGS